LKLQKFISETTSSSLTSVNFPFFSVATAVCFTLVILDNNFSDQCSLLCSFIVSSLVTNLAFITVTLRWIQSRLLPIVNNKGHWIMCLCHAFRIKEKHKLEFVLLFASWSWHHFGGIFNHTSKDQSAHYPYRIVMLKEIMSKLTILRSRTITMMWKNVLASLKVKDNLGMMSKQMMDKWQYVKSSQSLIYMYMYMVKKTQTTCQRLELQTFVDSKSRHYQVL